MMVAKSLHVMAKSYGVPPHILMQASPAELSFDFEVYQMGTAE